MAVMTILMIVVGEGGDDGGDIYPGDYCMCCAYVQTHCVYSHIHTRTIHLTHV